jgi:molecular chaperone DnaK (HSP70)
MGEPNFLFEYEGKSYRAEEISSYILRKMVQDAEQNLGEPITDVVITCPAYFGINEREATRVAGEIAGFNIRQIVNEPTAAAIAYGALDHSERRVVLVFDLGGGTFDITMIHIHPQAIEVICTGGDHNLGGKDWDDRIVAHMVQEFQRATGTTEDILEDPDTWQDLQLSAERAKKILSQREKTPILITHGGERVKIELERHKFEEITADLLERTVLLTQEMLATAQEKGYDRYDDIILVGGATRMPQVAARVKKAFHMEPRMFDPDEAVAKGAAIFGWKLSLNDNLVTRIARKTDARAEPTQDLLETAPPDVVAEVVRQVAEETGYTLPAVQRSLVKIRDVASKSFGVAVRNPQNEELVFNLIIRNTGIPVKTEKAFFTAVENQKTVLIRIMENESGEKTVPVERAVEIGTAVLDLPPNLPAELPVEIAFTLNEEGRLHITAAETAESRTVEVVIETCSVIQGQELAEAKARSQSLVVH